MGLIKRSLASIKKSREREKNRRQERANLQAKFRNVGRKVPKEDPDFMKPIKSIPKTPVTNAEERRKFIEGRFNMLFQKYVNEARNLKKQPAMELQPIFLYAVIDTVIGNDFHPGNVFNMNESIADIVAAATECPGKDVPKRYFFTDAFRPLNETPWDQYLTLEKFPDDADYHHIRVAIITLRSLYWGDTTALWRKGEKGETRSKAARINSKPIPEGFEEESWLQIIQIWSQLVSANPEGLFKDDLNDKSQGRRDGILVILPDELEGAQGDHEGEQPQVTSVKPVISAKPVAKGNQLAIPASIAEFNHYTWPPRFICWSQNLAKRTDAFYIIPFTNVTQDEDVGRLYVQSKMMADLYEACSISECGQWLLFEVDGKFRYADLKGPGNLVDRFLVLLDGDSKPDGFRFVHPKKANEAEAKKLVEGPLKTFK
ncbi:hypothetical protein K432DRAFT_430161 [Lepidopterella palustris CBS 459.81]|uniref:Uncharacterized protein n=1 Tax=Lepidopterella palustris CBS 459.81 TaxID=1314670 RepID=A0A8E2DYP6_9PEZI|nr:hypothetical protein K432DRAFT_430161 [Lepidopterella palustris CBS 459.81]